MRRKLSRILAMRVTAMIRPGVRSPSLIISTWVSRQITPSRVQSTSGADGDEQ